MGPDPRTGNPIQREGDLKTLWQRRSWEDRATDRLCTRLCRKREASAPSLGREHVPHTHLDGGGPPLWCLRPPTGTSLFHGLRTLLQG